MKFFIAITTCLLFAASSLAQSVQIGNIENGEPITAGGNLTVMVVRQDTISSSDEVAVVIALRSCGSDPCSIPGFLGDVLYNGPFSPVEPNPNPLHQQPHQNFTVQIPAVDFGTERGNGVITVAHFYLLGAVLTPSIEEVNVNVTIV